MPSTKKVKAKTTKVRPVPKMGDKVVVSLSFPRYPSHPAQLEGLIGYVSEDYKGVIREWQVIVPHAFSFHARRNDLHIDSPARLVGSKTIPAKWTLTGFVTINEYAPFTKL